MILLINLGKARASQWPHFHEKFLITRFSRNYFKYQQILVGRQEEEILLVSKDGYSISGPGC